MKPTAIITADIHIPHSVSYQPICREDDYWSAFQEKIEFICKIQKEYDNIPILDGGDLCNRYRLDPEVEAWCINNLPLNIFTIPGNHEIPDHNLNYLHKSSLSVFEASECLSIIQLMRTSKSCTKEESFDIYGFPYGRDIIVKLFAKIKDRKSIALIHTMVYPSRYKAISDKIQYTNGFTLLRKMKDFDLIITGHNHDSFIVKSNGRILINPGSLMRSSASQKNYQPRIFLWYQKDNRIEPIDIPIRKEVISDKHIRKQKEEENRMNAFIESLHISEKEKDSEINFEKNMEIFLRENKIKQSVQSIIAEVME